jgi:PAS domain S-box-containing protein
MTSDAGRNKLLSPVTPALFTLPVVLFGLIAFLVVAVAGYLFLVQRDAAQHGTHETVRVMAQFKAKAVDRWLTERRGDAWALAQQLATRDAFKAWLDKPDAQGGPAGQIRQHLGSLGVYRNYREVLLTDVTGWPLLSASGQLPVVDESTASLIRRVAATRQLQVSIQEKGDDAVGPQGILIGAPVLDGAGGDGRVVAVLMLGVDPQLDLIPSIEGWPGASPGAEVYLLAVEGEGMRFIGSPRQRPLAPRIQPAESSIASAVSRGTQGFVEGTDYRGTPVLAGISAVPGTPWQVVAQIDAAEVYGPIRRLAVVYSLVIIALVTAMGFLLMAAWRRREVLCLTARHRADIERLEMAQRFELLSKYANDIILLVDASGRITEVNDRALSAYGRAREDLVGARLGDIFAPSGTPSSALDPMRPGPERNDGAIFESIHRRHDGTTFPVEISVRRMEIEGQSWQQLIVRDITERKQAERAVRDGERLLQMISDTIDEVFWVVDMTTGRFTYLSAAFEKVTGLDSRAMSENPAILYDLMPLEDRDRVAQGRQHGFASGQAYSHEYRLRSPDGSERWIWGRGFPVIEEDGSVKTFIGVAQDITERKLSEQALQRTTRALKTLSYANDALVHATDEDWLFDQMCQVIVNQGGYRMAWVGLADDDPGRSVRPIAKSGFGTDYLDTADVSWANNERGRGPTGTAIRDGTVQIVQAFFDDPRILPWQEEARKRGYASSVALPLKDSTRVFGALTIYAPEPDAFGADEVAVLSDLASNLSFGVGALRTRAEHKAAENTIRERERLLRLISDTIDEVFWIMDPVTRRVVYVNSAAARMLGRAPHEVNQHLDGAADFFHDEDRERVYQNQREAFANGQPYTNGYRIRRPDGSLRWIWSRGFPVVEDDGSVSAFVGVAQDVTDRKEAEAKFLQAQKLETVGHLTGGVAHDFNNLLMAIQFGIEFARDSVRLGMDANEQFDMVLDATQRGADLVRRLSVFSRQQELEPKVVDPSHLVRQALRLIRTALPETITTEIQVQDIISPIYVDAGQMENALLNLAINARDAMPNGGNLIFSIRNVDPRMVEIAVADAGTGMPPEVRARALEPFFTTKELGKGTGLGLSMVYGFVTQSGGALEIDSEQGKGTTVRMSFPAAIGSPNAAVQRRTNALRGGSRLGHVVLVDDEMGVRKALEILLKPRSTSLVALASGPDAMNAMASMDRIDMLVSDVVLPGGISGFDLADAATARHIGCKVLLMSGYSTEAERDRGGARNYRLMQKPFTPEALMAELDALGALP